jgi:hypothetical protein
MIGIKGWSETKYYQLCYSAIRSFVESCEK